MGCLLSKKGEKLEDEEPEVFSWERQDRPDPKDFTIADLKGGSAGRTPGKVNGQQFIIRDCQDTNIYIYDHSATITIDDCVGCNMFLGPIKGSVYFRDCKDCKVIVACQQFRTRDCKKMDIFLCCATQPIIESSTGMKFGCFRYYYPELESQFEAAGLSLYNNNWSNIHDFTPVPGEITWSILPEDAQVDNFVPLPNEEFSSVKVSTVKDESSVPVTLGSRRKPFNEVCLAIFFHSPQRKDKIKHFFEKIKEKECILVQTKEVNMKTDEIARLTGSTEYNDVAIQGSLIGIEVNGTGCIETCREACGQDNPDIFLSSNAQKAVQEIDQFYNFVDMTMN